MATKIICGDALTRLDAIRRTHGRVPCLFADPPDNIGLGYDGYDDAMPDGEYISWLGDFLVAACHTAGTVWLSFNAKWTLPFGCVAHQITTAMRYECKPMVQTFTFGQHRHSDFGNNHRPLWRFKHPSAEVYTDQIRVQSWRQANGDKRADPRGRVPGDVFDFPRVTGNSRQRRSWHPTQLHEGLVERCILSCTQPRDLVIDPFAGTGTTGRVCQRINRECILIERSEAYCRKLREEFGSAECAA